APAPSVYPAGDPPACARPAATSGRAGGGRDHDGGRPGHHGRLGESRTPESDGGPGNRTAEGGGRRPGQRTRERSRSEEASRAHPEQVEVVVLGSGEGGKCLAWHIARSGRRAGLI